MIYRLAGVAAAIAFVAGSPSAAQTAGLQRQADALLAAAYPADGPGASVVVTYHGKVIYEGNRGLADVANKRPITSRTVFRIGSITKQFAAAVVLQLASEGRLKLTDPINKYLPGYPQPGGSATIAQLLGHTSGIQSYTEIPGWMVESNFGHAYTTEQLMAVFKDLPSPSKPGEKWEYNNSGYVLVGAVIEAVTGRTWSSEVEQRIARPLELTTLRYGIDENKVPAMAVGYTLGDKGAVRAEKINMTVPGAAGALDATAGDLARWGNALHHGRVLSSTYYAQMITPAHLNDGSTAAYGFGLGLSKLRGSTVIEHSGGINGFASDSVYVPSADVFVVVLANAVNPKSSSVAVANRLAAMVMGKPYETFTARSLDAADITPFLGLYDFGNAKRVLSMREGRLYAQREGGTPAEIFPAGGGRYFYGPVNTTWFELRRDTAGKPEMAFHADDLDAETIGTYQGTATSIGH